MIKLSINNNGKNPVYYQIYQQISMQILKKEVTANESLPSIRFLANDLKISVITVKTAYEMLEKEGYIYTVLGKGTFVKEIKDGKGRLLLLAEEKLSSDLPYYRQLGLKKEELMELIDKKY